MCIFLRGCQVIIEAISHTTADYQGPLNDSKHGAWSQSADIEKENVRPLDLSDSIDTSAWEEKIRWHSVNLALYFCLGGQTST